MKGFKTLNGVIKMKEDLPEKVVAQLSGATLGKYENILHKKNAAEEMLTETQKEKAEIWRKLAETHDLDLEENEYTINMETGEVMEQTSFES